MKFTFLILSISVGMNAFAEVKMKNGQALTEWKLTSKSELNFSSSAADKETSEIYNCLLALEGQHSNMAKQGMVTVHSSEIADFSNHINKSDGFDRSELKMIKRLASPAPVFAYDPEGRTLKCEKVKDLILTNCTAFTDTISKKSLRKMAEKSAKSIRQRKALLLSCKWNAEGSDCESLKRKAKFYRSDLTKTDEFETEKHFNVYRNDLAKDLGASIADAVNSCKNVLHEDTFEEIKKLKSETLDIAPFTPAKAVRGM